MTDDVKPRQDGKSRLNRHSRNQLKRLLFRWYSQLEREPMPSRFRDAVWQKPSSMN